MGAKAYNSAQIHSLSTEIRVWKHNCPRFLSLIHTSRTCTHVGYCGRLGPWEKRTTRSSSKGEKTKTKIISPTGLKPGTLLRLLPFLHLQSETLQNLQRLCHHIAIGLRGRRNAGITMNLCWQFHWLGAVMSIISHSIDSRIYNNITFHSDGIVTNHNIE